MTQQDRNNAAVSETVGYILLLAIVTLSMGVIYIVGYPALQSNIDANAFESAEQNFIVLQSNMERVAFDQTPVKVLKLKLQSSEIATSNRSSITIDYDGNTFFYPTGEIEYSKDNKAISYEMGSVFKRYPPSSVVMVSEPKIYTGKVNNVNVTTIGIVSVNGHNDFISGNGIVTLTMKNNESYMDTTSGRTDVKIQINSTHAQKWEEFLEENGFDIISSSSSMVSAMRNDTRLTVSRHVVDVELS